MDSDRRDRVIGLFYEAAVNPTLWPTALAAYADAAGVEEAHLALRDPSRNICVFQSGGRIFTPEVVKSYFVYYHGIDPLRKVVGEHSEGDLIVCPGDYLSEEFINGDEFYQDYIIPAGTRYMAGFAFHGGRGVLTLHTRKGPLDRDDIEQRVGAMGRHGCNAMKLALQFAARTSSGEALRSALDHESIVCFMTNAELRLIECSHAAASLIETGNPFRLRRGFLRLHSDASAKRFRELVARCAAGAGGGMIRITNDEGCWLIEISPAGVTADNPFDLRRGNCALIFVRQPMAQEPIDVSKIQLFLDCTAAESEIASALLGGCSPAQIASSRKVSLSTVRTQIRHLLDSAGVNRITELVAVLSRLH
jgi:DNA-binding CsgD family transcriptional regulator